MSFFHALFSLGALGGAALLTLILALGLPVAGVIYASALLVGGWLALRRSWITPEQADEDTSSPASGRRLPLPVVLFLGMCISLATLSEGGAIDWSALHMNRVMGLAVSEAGQTVVLFSIAITTIRFAGDWLANRYSVHLLMGVPMILAGGLLLTAIMNGNVTLLMASYIVFGLAVGNAFPIIISQAGSAGSGHRLRDISIIVGFAYVGLITGPALLGVIAHFLGLNAAILALSLIATLLGFLVLFLPRFVPQVTAGRAE